MENKGRASEEDIRLDAQARLEGRVKLLEKTVNTLRDQVQRTEVDRNGAVKVVQQLRAEIKEALHKKMEELWETGGRKLRKDIEERHGRQYELLYSRMELADEMEKHNLRNTRECLHEIVKSIEEIKRSSEQIPPPEAIPLNPGWGGPTSREPPAAGIGAFHPQSKGTSYRWFHELGVTREQMLKHLLEIGKMEPLSRHVIWAEPPAARRDPNKHCKYHQAPGHSTEGCLTLRDHIQGLIDEGIITKQGNKWV